MVGPGFRRDDDFSTAPLLVEFRSRPRLNRWMNGKFKSMSRPEQAESEIGKAELAIVSECFWRKVRRLLFHHGPFILRVNSVTREGLPD